MMMIDRRRDRHGDVNIIVGGAVLAEPITSTPNSCCRR